jgi:hypothetical protein
MLGVLGDRQRARRSGKKIQVIHVISRSSDYGMVTTAHEDGIPVFGFHCSLD